MVQFKVYSLIKLGVYWALWIALHQARAIDESKEIDDEDLRRASAVVTLNRPDSNLYVGVSECAVLIIRILPFRAFRVM